MQNTRDLDSTISPSLMVLIDRFQLSSVTKPSVILVLGPKACGKTTFLNRYCEERLKQDPKHMFAKFSSWENKCTSDILNDIINQQSKIENLNRHVSIVIDGLTQADLKGIDKELGKVVCNGRFCRISVVIADTCLNLPPHIRCNTDYMIFWPNHHISTIKRMHDHFFGMIPFAVYDNIIKELAGQAIVSVNDKRYDFLLKRYSNDLSTDFLELPEDNIISLPCKCRASKISEAIKLLDNLKDILRELES